MPRKQITYSARSKLRVNPTTLWAFLANTDQFNRAVGLPAMTYNKTEDSTKKGHYHVETSFLGIRLSFEELPYDWVDEKYYEVIRRYPAGPIVETVSGVRIFPIQEGTEVEIFLRVTPRNLLGWAVASTVLKRITTKNSIDLVKRFEGSQSNDAESEPVVEPTHPVNRRQLAMRIAALRSSPVASSLVVKLERHLSEASDLDVVSMRPFELALQWDEDRMDVLTMFLFASIAGLVDLHWVVLCPNCRGMSSDSMTLSQLKTETHCDTCEIQYGTDLASSVEARFSVHQAVRVARREIYCIGGPANTPHIFAQLRLDAGVVRTEKVTFRPSSLRVHSYQTEGIQTVLVNESGESTSRLEVSCKPDNVTVSARHIRPGDFELSVANRLSDECLVVVDSETWKESAATAACVTSLQSFKDLFPEEAVAPGQDLGISSIAILFTDLRGSTALYKRVGDSRAFAFVQNHFRYLMESVSKFHGGVVKTMGDAIMASFPRSLDALAAALEMQEQWDSFSGEHGNLQDIRLKVGIHQGPAIATNNKGKFDCFGATINLASRLEKLSEGDDVIISDILKRDSEVTEFLDDNSPRLSAESFDANLKGFDEERFTLWRIRLRR